MAQEMPVLLLFLHLSTLWQGTLAENSRYNLEVQRTVTVQEGLCVFVPCIVMYPRSSGPKSDKTYGYWYHGGADTGRDTPVATNDPQKGVQTATKGRFQLIGDPGAYNCSLRITDVQKKDSGDYFFRVERGGHIQHNYREQPLFLIVTDLTYTPEIYIPEILKSGHPGKVICAVPWACEKATPPNFFWTRAGIDSAVLATPRSSVLTFTAQPRDHGTHLTCQVTFPAVPVTIEKTIQLISCAPHSTAINTFWRNCTGGPSSCLCAAQLQDRSWPLVLTLIRGALMAAGFLLTFGLTWIYYSRYGSAQGYRTEASLRSLHPKSGSFGPAPPLALRAPPEA